MGQTNGISTPLYDNDTANQKQNRHAEDFMQYHDILSPQQLIDLADQDTPESRERLLEIAEKYDIPFHESMNIREIVDKIILGMDNQDSPNMYIGTE
jgi:hypothetical protein